MRTPVRNLSLLIAGLLAHAARADDDACRIVAGRTSPILYAPDVQREFSRGELALHAVVPDDTGTMHFASESTVVTADGASASLGREIPQAQVKLDATHYLVFGWSSRGSGMQTQSAFLLRRARQSLAITDYLRFESSREDGRLLLRLGGPHPALGVVAEPGAPVGEAWSLSTRSREMDLAQARRSAARLLVGGSCDFVSFHPPFGERGPAALPDNRAVWFEIRGDRFVLSGEHR